MKKQLLIAAVAATMTMATTADVSITGSAAFKTTDGVYSHEADLVVSGTSGDTSVTMNISLDGTTVAIEDLYLKTSIAGVDLKMGQWEGSSSELGASSAASEKLVVSTSFGGISIAYKDTNGANSTTIGGEFGGIAVSHEINQDSSTETTASGSMGGVNVDVHTTEAAGKTNTAFTLSTEIQGATLTYVQIDADAAMDSDGYVGEFPLTAGQSAKAIGISTIYSGNTIGLKAITIAGEDSTELSISRDLGNGTMLDVTYTDTDTDEKLEVELSVAF
jgi:hypothetical protein